MAESPGSPQPEMVGDARVGGQKKAEGERGWAGGADLPEGLQKGAGHRSRGWTERGTRPAGRVYFLWPPTATRDWGPAGDQMFLS